MLVMYQIETVPIPILDKNKQAQSYTQLKINKPYIALNTETYITLCMQELHTCRRIGYEYCDVEAENNFCLESLTACENSATDLAIYFTVNLAFVNSMLHAILTLDI